MINWETLTVFVSHFIIFSIWCARNHGGPLNVTFLSGGGVGRGIAKIFREVIICLKNGNWASVLRGMYVHNAEI